MLESTHHQLGPDQISLITHKPNLTSISSTFLFTYVQAAWRVFSTRHDQSKSDVRFVTYDNTRGTNGKYLLLNHYSSSYYRGIVATNRFLIPDNEDRSICIQFALYMPNTNQESVLEIFQMESGIIRNAFKIWDTRLSLTRWRMFSVKAKPQSRDSRDIYFLLVSYFCF